MNNYNPNKFIHLNDIKISKETEKLLKKAQEVYKENFTGKTWYGRCLFLSWYCSIGDCKFCFRSTDRHKNVHPETSRRSMGSVLLEALFCKIFKWRIEFLTGGYGILSFEDLLEYIKNVNLVYGEKIWLNLGVLTKEHLDKIKPHVKGICASLETLTPEIHEYVCPNKPLKPYDEMFNNLTGFKKSAAIIVGLGDKLNDLKHLFAFVEKHSLDRLTVYALKPVKGTEFTEGPSVEEYVQWLAHIRIRFPKLEIIAGTNLRRSEEAGYLIKAGANAITKFPATKQFATKKAQLVEKLVKKEGRNFISNLTVLPDVDWEKEIENLPILEKYKQEMKEKLPNYIRTFQNPHDIDVGTTS